MKIEIVGDKAYIDTPYNREFVAKIKTIGGARWDSERREWIIPAACVDQARTIMREVFGECDLPDDSRRVNVMLTFDDWVCRVCSSVSIFGKTIARAYGRDSGATVGEDAVFIKGKPTSGGSRANWETQIKPGSVVVLRNVPETILNEELPDGVTYGIMPDEEKPNREALLAEKERLVARLAEIEKLLS